MKTIDFNRNKLTYKCDPYIERRFFHFTNCDMVCYYAQKVKGNIIEIGCNDGITTRDLALSNPKKIVYGVDTYEVEGNQKYEIPDKIGQYTNGLENVKIINSDSRKFDFFKLDNIEFAFLDGGHDYETVKSDFLNVYCIMKKGYIMIHDYRNDNQFKWVGVKKFVDQIDKYFNIYLINNTMLVLIDLTGGK